ncbi:gamma-glutamyl-gamma-aminobutyrate hydrolase family protein [Leucobacter luti]|uniref:Putative glutamine amidotransferase n=1 Tax=Leucobacter luti TaxID=340320 RepID=A0A4Q7U6C8_9MICO|nr:gamma-glutamyl-gamma-aminobutyrate hydrolase family protein [Leucobacter luti]MBL3700529.1 gamma-glutamyl-gamma-aminobutyrate hydrolase family protein [Leucobacter luti]RZT68637.1 putative glutamine amidotransferase [Leucobacter luti]
MASNGSERPAPAERAPIIGVTSYLEQAQTGVWDVRASFLPQVYLAAVTDAGGIAVVLPPQPIDADIAAAIVATLDGLILSGGADIDPARYGEAAHERTGAPRADRDAFEAALLTAALDAELPFLGICRGAQLLNVELGGTLIQHLPDLVGDDRYQLGGGVFNPIEVEVDAGSRIADVLGGERDATAHLYHHQGIGELGAGLTETSRTADGIVQSVELTSVPFGIAVQWHPEENPRDRRLFAGLVAAAREYRAARASARASRPPGQPAPPAPHARPASETTQREQP